MGEIYGWNLFIESKIFYAARVSDDSEVNVVSDLSAVSGIYFRVTSIFLLISSTFYVILGSVEILTGIFLDLFLELSCLQARQRSAPINLKQNNS